MAIKRKKISPRKAQKRQTETLDYRLLFDRLDREVEKAESNDKWERAAYAIDRAKKRLYRLPPSEFRTKCLQELERRYWTVFWSLPASCELSVRFPPVEDDPIGKQFSDH
jgi:hypothetical protein